MIKINQNHILAVLRYGLLSVIFLLPFVVTPWTIFPFVFGKTLFFQSAIEILAAFYIALIIAEPRYKPRFDAITALVLGYLGILIIASALGVDWRRSFWGNEERGTGLIAWLHLTAFFLMARSVFENEKEKNRAYFVALVSGIFLSFIALLQAAGVKIFGVDLGTRLSSTIANPIFFATLLIFYAAFAFYAASKKKGPVRLLCLICALFFIGMIFATQTRGAVFALAGGIAFFLIVSAWRSHSVRARLAVVGFFSLLAVIVLLFWINIDSPFIRRNPILNRYIVLKDTTASTRILGWGIAWNAIKEKPLLGWGQDNFYIAFNKYYNPDLLEYSYYETWWDRPHNTALEVAVHGGLIGLLIYLAIFAYSAVSFLRRRTVLGNILASLLFTYFLQNLLAFDTPSSLMLFMLLLSGAGQAPGKGNSGGESLQNTGPKVKNAITILIFLLMASGVFVWKLNWQPMVASAAMLNAAVYAADRSDVGSINYFRTALKLPTPYKEETHVQVAQIITAILAKQSIPPERFHEFFDFGEKEIKAVIAMHPRHTYFQYMLGRLYTEALHYDGSYADEAEAAFGRAIELSPKRQQIYFGFAKFLVDQGRNEEALEIYRRMAEEAPNVGEAHWFYAVMLQDGGRREDAEREIGETGRLGYMPQKYEERLLIARIMAKQKNYQRVIDYIENALKLKPDQVELYAQLAVAYKELGNKEKAREFALRAAELDSAFAAEAEIFLKMLEN